MKRKPIPSIAIPVLVVGALVLSATPASAGTYEVVACGGAAGGGQNAFAAAADPGLAAYSSCPNTPSNPASGIVTRASATAGPGAVPHLAGGYQIFEAPPGASLASMSFDVAAIRLSSYWTTGLVAYDNAGNFNTGDLPYGCYAGSPGCVIGTRAFIGPATASLGGHTKVRLETRCVNPAGCDISASGYQPGMRALFSIANVRVQVQDGTVPSVSPLGGALFGGGWLRGTAGGYTAQHDNVGIMVNRTIVDGRVVYSEDFRDPGWPGSVACNFTRPRPCFDIPGAGSQVATGSLSDGPHELRVEAIDAAGNVGSTARSIRVDNTPPPRVNAHAEGGEGWRTTNGFDIRWPGPGGQAAPVTAAHYRLCSVGANPRCEAGSRSGVAIDRLAGVAVPGAGDYELRVWLEDEAGNSDSALASDPVHLRFDDRPPNAAFEPLDDGDPLKIDVQASDADSGIATGTIELRRAGWRQWRTLPTTVAGGRLTTRIDDLELPDDRYELRASVRDRAGNETTSYSRGDGAKMEVQLPLRAASRIRLLGQATQPCRGSRGSAARRCRARARRIRRTGAVLLRGVLERSDGRPLAGSIDLLEQPRSGGDFHKIASLDTDSSGRFEELLVAGPSRTIRVRSDGSPLVKPATEQLTIAVPASTSIAPSRRFLRNGQTVDIRGRLRGRPVPTGGKLIDLQAYYRGKWRTFATPRSDGAGRWSFRYRFEATTGVVRYRFRARIRREEAYPYELGYSRAISVTVRGP
jgi:hypothetical protein